MKIAMIGAGYVGLVSSVCFSEFGVDVVCIDNDVNRIKKLNVGECPIYEPGLENLMVANVAAGGLRFTSDLSDAVIDADAVFIAVGTPSRRGDGHADLTYVYAAAEEIAKELKDYSVVVTKSTVPVGTSREVKNVIKKLRPDLQFDVASNPEFLREGSAIGDFMRPDRVVIGTDSQRAVDVLVELYRPLYLSETPIIKTELETAELIKYAANSFLATKITFINEFASLCEKVGADVQDVARAIGLDGRIGSKFLHAGPGYGGSCFPKDTMALVETARDVDAPVRIVETVIEINEMRKAGMAQKVMEACGGSVLGKLIAVLGLTFKPNTDDMRDSPSLAIISDLQESGASIRAYDPQGMDEAASLIEGVTFCEGTYEVMEDADALVIVTEWNAFRALDLERVKMLLKKPVMIDLRNIYSPREMEQAGFHYYSVGRAPVVQEYEL